MIIVHDGFLVSIRSLLDLSAVIAEGIQIEKVSELEWISNNKGVNNVFLTL